MRSIASSAKAPWNFSPNMFAQTSRMDATCQKSPEQGRYGINYAAGTSMKLFTKPIARPFKGYQQQSLLAYSGSLSTIHHKRKRVRWAVVAAITWVGFCVALYMVPRG